jgi:hypothetical protein
MKLTELSVNLNSTVALLNIEPVGSIICGGNTQDRPAIFQLFLPRHANPSGSMFSKATVWWFKQWEAFNE